MDILAKLGSAADLNFRLSITTEPIVMQLSRLGIN